MSDQVLFILIVASMIIALALGIWIGLGYPGLYDRHQDTGARVPRKTPYRIALDRFGEWVGSVMDRAVRRFLRD